MMINRPIQPPPLQHQNNDQPLYKGYLATTTVELIRKRPLRTYPNRPLIGSYRFPNQNYEKKEFTNNHQHNYTLALVMDDAFRYMNTIELRVEDYFHLRKCPHNCDLYKAIGNISEKPPFNTELRTIHPELPLKQPDLNRAWGVKPIQQGLFQTPSDRLSHLQNLNSGELAGGNRSLQQPVYIVPTYKHLGNVNEQKQRIQLLNSAQRNSPTKNKPTTTTVTILNNVNNLAFSSLDNPQNINISQKDLNSPLRQPQPQPQPQTTISPQKPPKIETPISIFLQYFQKDLISAHAHNFSLTPYVQSILSRCFKYEENEHIRWKQRGQMDPTALMSKKDRELFCIKRVIDGVERQLINQDANRVLGPDDRECAIEVMKILRLNYNRRLSDNCPSSSINLTEESVRTVSERLEERSTELVHRYQSLNSSSTNPNSFESPTKTAKPIPDPSFLLGLGTLPNNRKRNQTVQSNNSLQHQIYTINCLRNRLKILYQQERLEREEHLFDFAKRHQRDDQEYIAYRNRKKKSQEIVVIVREEPKQHKKHHTTPSQKSHLGKDSPFVNEFTTHSKKCLTTLTYTASIFWVEKQLPEELYKVFEGTLQLFSQFRKEDIESYLTKHLKIEMRVIRNDAKFNFGSLKKDGNNFKITIKIQQEKVNITPPYFYQAIYANSEKKGVQLSELRIVNQQGEICWKDVNIEKFDFTTGCVKIGDNTVECSCECLNKPCIITFNSFPRQIMAMEETYFHAEIETALRKRVSSFMNMELHEINWKRHRYSIKSQEFFLPAAEDDIDIQQTLQHHQEELKLERERLGIRESTLTQSVII